MGFGDRKSVRASVSRETSAKPGLEGLGDSGGGLAVPEDVTWGGWESEGYGVFEVGLEGFRGGESGVAGLDGFGSVGHLSSHEAGNPVGGGFFLHSTGIGDDRSGP